MSFSDTPSIFATRRANNLLSEAREHRHYRFKVVQDGVTLCFIDPFRMNRVSLISNKGNVLELLAIVGDDEEPKAFFSMQDVVTDTGSPCLLCTIAIEDAKLILEPSFGDFVDTLFKEKTTPIRKSTDYKENSEWA